jgi:hypothetical protein
MATPSQADCEKWFASPLVNPLTKRSIQEGKPVWKKLEKDCAPYKSKPESKPISTKPAPKSISTKPVAPKASPKLGRKLTKVRKGDCVGEDKIWKVGQGCFEVKKSSPKSPPKVIKPVEFIDTAALVGAEEWEYVGPLKKDCKPIPPLRWTPGSKGKKGKCEAPKGTKLHSTTPKKVSPKKESPKKVGPKYSWKVIRPTTDLTKEEIKSGKYDMKESHFVRRVGGVIQKDCFEEGPIQRQNIDIKKFSFDRKEAEKKYISYMGPSTPEIEDWIKKNQTLVVPDKVLSKEAYDFLSPYLSGAHMFGTKKVTLKPSALKNLQQFRLDKPILLFRGIHFGFKNFDMIEQFCAQYMDPAKSYTFREDKPSSWTWNYTMAENFAKIGSFGFVIARVFQPEEILIDLRLCKEYLDMRRSKSQLQDEVIVMPGAYKCEIVLPFPPGVKNGLLKPENLEALKKIRDFHNISYAMPRIVSGTFGIDIQGLIGKIEIMPERDLIFDFDFDSKSNSPILHYGLFLGPKTDKEAVSKKLDKEFNITRFDSILNTYWKPTDKCPQIDGIYITTCYKVTTYNSKTGSLESLYSFLEKLYTNVKSIKT